MTNSVPFKTVVMRFRQYQRVFDVCGILFAFEIPNYKSQITNKIQTTNYKIQTKRCPADNFELLRRGAPSGVFKRDRAVCNFGHCNLGFVCNLYFVICNFFICAAQSQTNLYGQYQETDL
jgi:hypothetical protein